MPTDYKAVPHKQFVRGAARADSKGDQSWSIARCHSRLNTYSTVGPAFSTPIKTYMLTRCPGEHRMRPLPSGLTSSSLQTAPYDLPRRARHELCSSPASADYVPIAAPLSATSIGGTG